jgi:hypothetical protein
MGLKKIKKITWSYLNKIFVKFVSFYSSRLFVAISSIKIFKALGTHADFYMFFSLTFWVACIMCTVPNLLFGLQLIGGRGVVLPFQLENKLGGLD